jgi:hypothetical protein
MIVAAATAMCRKTCQQDTFQQVWLHILCFGWVLLLDLLIGAERVKTFKALARGKGGRFIGQ